MYECITILYFGYLFFFISCASGYNKFEDLQILNINTSVLKDSKYPKNNVTRRTQYNDEASNEYSYNKQLLPINDLNNTYINEEYLYNYERRTPHHAEPTTGATTSSSRQEPYNKYSSQFNYYQRSPPDLRIGVEDLEYNHLPPRWEHHSRQPRHDSWLPPPPAHYRYQPPPPHDHPPPRDEQIFHYDERQTRQSPNYDSPHYRQPPPPADNRRPPSGPFPPPRGEPSIYDWGPPPPPHDRGPPPNGRGPPPQFIGRSYPPRDYDDERPYPFRSRPPFPPPPRLGTQSENNNDQSKSDLQKIREFIAKFDEDKQNMELQKYNKSNENTNAKSGTDEDENFQSMIDLRLADNLDNVTPSGNTNVKPKSPSQNNHNISMLPPNAFSYPPNFFQVVPITPVELYQYNKHPCKHFIRGTIRAIELIEVQRKCRTPN